MYDPSVGRFLEEDPTGFAAGDANFYRYVGNDPTNEVDPSGLSAIFMEPAPASANGGQQMHLYTRPAWICLNRSPTFVGTLDVGSGLVIRRGFAVPLATVEEEGNSFFGSSPNWDTWFRDRDTNRAQVAQDNLEQRAAQFQSMMDFPRASGAANATDAFNEAHRLITSEFPAFAAQLGATTFGPTVALKLIGQGYRVYKGIRGLRLGSVQGGKLVIHSEAETKRIIQSAADALGPVASAWQRLSNHVSDLRSFLASRVSGLNNELRSTFARAAGTPHAGNVAAAELEIAGRSSLRMSAFAGETNLANFAPYVAARDATLAAGQAGRSFLNNVDAEFKILEQTLGLTTRESRGTLYIFTERAMCPNCANAVSQFNVLRPNINVLVNH